MVTSDLYGEGDLVRVTAVGKVVVPVGGKALYVGFEDGSALSLDTPGVTVERLSPVIEPGVVYRDARNDLCWGMDGGALAWLNHVVVVSDIDAGRLPLTRVWSPLDAEPPVGEVNIGAHYRRLPPHLRKDAPAEPLRTWPPTEPDLWFEDDAGEQCVSVRGESDVYVVFPSSEYPHARYRLDTTQRARGPMKPIPAPGGASC